MEAPLGNTEGICPQYVRPTFGVGGFFLLRDDFLFLRAFTEPLERDWPSPAWYQGFEDKHLVPSECR